MRIENLMSRNIISSSCMKKTDTMPLETRAALQLSLLLMAVPVQYLFTQYMSTTPGQRSVALKRYLLNVDIAIYFFMLHIAV